MSIHGCAEAAFTLVEHGRAEQFLSSLVDAHGAQLRRYFAARLAEPSEAQDLVQEVYLRILRFGRPAEIRCPRAYVYTVAASVAFEHWSKRSALPPHVAFEEADLERRGGEDLSVAAEQEDLLAELLRRLPPKVGAALIWAHRDGHTYEEIGTRLSVPKNRVKKYLAKALAHCRKHAAVGTV